MKHAPSDSHVTAPPRPRQHKTILLVEENAPLLAVLRTVLVEAGYSVLDCRDGALAVEQCERQSDEVDLVLSDVVTPDMLGTQLAHQIMARWPRMRVVLFPGHPESDRHIQDVGSDIALLKKPISREALLRTVRKLLEVPKRPPSGIIHTVYITRSKTYLLTCPACQERAEMHVSKLPHTTKPYAHECVCGETTLFRLISFRRAPRKTVQLTATIVATAPKGTMRIPCEIEDISTNGMRVRIEPIPNFRPDSLKVVLTLPGRTKHTLQIACALRRSDMLKHQLSLALEFQSLPSEDEQALTAYLMA